MEYLLVKFAESRSVIVDEITEGMTNKILELEAGNHVVSIEGPPDFTPECFEFILRNTSESSPRVISFEKV